jgi:hypothetical protein
VQNGFGVKPTLHWTVVITNRYASVMHRKGTVPMITSTTSLALRALHLDHTAGEDCGGAYGGKPSGCYQRPE